MAETETPPRSTSAPPTRSLRAAMNPQARMQELLQRTAPSEPQVNDDTTALPVGSATSSVVAEEVGNADALVDAGTEKPETEKRSSASAQKSSSAVAQNTSSTVARKRGSTKAHLSNSTKAHLSNSTKSQKRGSAGGADPVRQAMLGMLAQPYPNDMDEGAMTVTSVKIPKPIWERLEYARTITKRDKQDIIADALRLYFDTLLEADDAQENGEGED